MLVLSRLPDQEVVIFIGGHRLVVRYIEKNGRSARLSFEVPPEAAVWRAEVYEELDQAGDEYASPDPRAVDRREHLWRAQGHRVERSVSGSNHVVRKVG